MCFIPGGNAYLCKESLCTLMGGSYMGPELFAEPNCETSPIGNVEVTGTCLECCKGMELQHRIRDSSRPFVNAWILPFPLLTHIVLWVT